MSGSKEHGDTVQIQWTGNLGQGTSSYRAYDRSYEVTTEGKPAISGSSEPAFCGDPERYNPEELLVASLSACHMLWYLHLCSNAKIVVTRYVDYASGIMAERLNGGGNFTEVVLKPNVTIQRESNISHAEQLHEKAHELCFIANSVNFPVRYESSIRVDSTAKKC